MANENGKQEKCNYLLSLSPSLRRKFKAWSAEQGVSMNTGLISLMETVTSKKKYKLQKRVLEVAK